MTTCPSTSSASLHRAETEGIRQPNSSRQHKPGSAFHRKVLTEISHIPRTTHPHNCTHSALPGQLRLVVLRHAGQPAQCSKHLLADAPPCFPPLLTNILQQNSARGLCQPRLCRRTHGLSGRRSRGKHTQQSLDNPQFGKLAPGFLTRSEQRQAVHGTGQNRQTVGTANQANEGRYNATGQQHSPNVV